MKLTEEQYAEIKRRQARGSTLFPPAAKEEKRRATRRKYGNVPTVVDGQQFDSKREAERFEELKLLEKAGAIRNLRTQVRYPLALNGQDICLYVSDFDYDRIRMVYPGSSQKQWEHVTEDVKSKATMTDVFRLKRKLMKAVHGIDIEIVE